MSLLSFLACLLSDRKNATRLFFTLLVLWSVINWFRLRAKDRAMNERLLRTHHRKLRRLRRKQILRNDHNADSTQCINSQLQSTSHSIHLATDRRQNRMNNEINCSNSSTNITVEQQTQNGMNEHCGRMSDESKSITISEDRSVLVAFSGAGFLGFYFQGVAAALHDFFNVDSPLVNWSGISAGSLTAASMAYSLPPESSLLFGIRWLKNLRKNGIYFMSSDTIIETGSKVALEFGMTDDKVLKTMRRHSLFVGVTDLSCFPLFLRHEIIHSDDFYGQHFQSIDELSDEDDSEDADGCADIYHCKATDSLLLNNSNSPNNKQFECDNDIKSEEESAIIIEETSEICDLKPGKKDTEEVHRLIRTMQRRTGFNRCSLHQKKKNTNVNQQTCKEEASDSGQRRRTCPSSSSSSSSSSSTSSTSDHSSTVKLHQSSFHLLSCSMRTLPFFRELAFLKGSLVFDGGFTNMFTIPPQFSKDRVITVTFVTPAICQSDIQPLPSERFTFWDIFVLPDLKGLQWQFAKGYRDAFRVRDRLHAKGLLIRDCWRDRILNDAHCEERIRFWTQFMSEHGQKEGYDDV